MKKVFIIHGFGGVPNGGWLPWLMTGLRDKGIYACALPMPNTDSPVVSDWVEEISHAVRNVPEEVFFVAHSLGVPALFRYLESLPEGRKISGALLVSGLVDPLDTENTESRFRIIDPFLRPEIDLEKIKDKSEKFLVLHGTADVTVPFSQAEKISSKLGCELRPVPGGAHFSQRTPPIYYELPEALIAVLEMLK